MLVPGTGQLSTGRRRRGLVLLGVFAALTVAVTAATVVRPLGVVTGLGDARFVAAVLAADALLLAFRLFAVVDAWGWPRSRVSLPAATVLGVLVALTAAPHVAAGYLALRGHDVLDAVFADDEPRDVLPSRGVFLAEPPPRVEGRERPPTSQSPVARVPSDPIAGARDVVSGSRRLQRPWVTILLLGTDEGPGNWGARTDTIIVAALERGTHRGVALGVPRNWVRARLGGAAGAELPRFQEPLNALYGFARSRPELFPGGDDPGATALKQTVSRLLGLRIDYYALVNLDGFRDVVDALGGVDIDVKERLVDEVTRPAWGETKPRIDVRPGRTYHFDGRTALAYVRSRKASNDYTRMTRQRCFLSAMADQLNVLDVLRHFHTLSATVKDSVRTDIPLSRVPDLVRLASGLEARETLTATFGLPYIAGRRKADRFPFPNLAKVRATVRRAILVGRERADADLHLAAKAC